MMKRSFVEHFDALLPEPLRYHHFPLDCRNYIPHAQVFIADYWLTIQTLGTILTSLAYDTPNLNSSSGLLGSEYVGMGFWGYDKRDVDFVLC